MGACDVPKSVKIQNNQLAVAQAENTVLAETAQGAANVDRGKSERVTNVLLGQGNHHR